MGKLYDFLMEGEAAAQETAEVHIAGFPYPFLIHSITEAENKAIRKTCQKVSFDKRTRQRSTETDQELCLSRLVAACCAEPNFKDAQLQARYGVVGEIELMDKILKPGQFNELMTAVMELNGFSANMDELRDEAKN